MDKRGKFIVFEGGEGSGKTTMSKLAVEKLKREGFSIIWTREPGGSPYAEKIRELILSDDAKHADAETMFGLFWAARRDHLMKTVLPALLRGETVLSDRFDASTYAYQIVGQEQPQLKDLFWKMRAHYLDEHYPDAYLFFDVHPDVGLARAKGRPEKSTHFDERDLAFHERIRVGFTEFATAQAIHHEFVDANLPKAEVEQRMLKTLRQILA